MIRMAEQRRVRAQRAQAVETRNASQKRVLFDKIFSAASEAMCGGTFALWGLAFKPNTNDLREAPSARHDGSVVGRGRKRTAPTTPFDGGVPAPSMETGPAFSAGSQGGRAEGRRRADHLHGMAAIL